MTTSEAVPSPWEICQAHFTFDKHDYKFRPVLARSPFPQWAPGGDDHQRLEQASLPLDTPLDDWQEAGLTKPSLVRVDRIALLPPTYLGTVGRIGRLSPRYKHRGSQALATLTR